jgi:uncharacterized membrane protein (DUF2068 family)
VATLEFLKGLLVVLVGFGLISLEHRGIDLEEVARSLLYALHLGGERHLSAAFLRAAMRLEDVNLVRLAVAGLLYSLMRFIEAYGLWMGRVWAQWFALASGAAYIPLELFELIRKPTPIRFILLLVSILIVVYMAYLRLRPRLAAASATNPTDPAPTLGKPTTSQ